MKPLFSVEEIRKLWDRFRTGTGMDIEAYAEALLVHHEERCPKYILLSCRQSGKTSAIKLAELQAENARLFCELNQMKAIRAALKAEAPNVESAKVEELTQRYLDLHTENARLREALEGILYAQLGGHIQTIAIGGGPDQGKVILDKARAALEGK